MADEESPLPAPDTGERAPAKVHDFRVLARLGQGGFADVYLANREGSHQPVALKVLREQVDERVREQVLARFHTEEAIARAIDHPAIVKIRATSPPGVSPAFIAMEYVEGTPFCDYFRGQASPTDLFALARLGREVAAAMAAAHRLGIVHRDLKPDNVLVTSGSAVEGGGSVKILDFGIAKAPLGLFARPQERAITRYVTELGTVMGTPPYMAPEQNGAAHAVTGKADVFALGMMLLLAIARIDEAELLGPGHLLLQPEDVAGLLRRCPELPERWVTLLVESLAFDPQDRPEMAEIERRLQRLAQRHEPFAAAVEDWLTEGTVPSAGKLRALLAWSATVSALTEDETRFLRHASATRLGRRWWVAGVSAVGALSVAAGAVAAVQIPGAAVSTKVALPVSGATVGALAATGPVTREPAGGQAAGDDPAVPSPEPPAVTCAEPESAGPLRTELATAQRELDQCQRAQRTARAEREALDAQLSEMRSTLSDFEIDASASQARLASLEGELGRARETAAEQGKQAFACRQELEGKDRLLTESTERWRTCARALRGAAPSAGVTPAAGAETHESSPPPAPPPEPGTPPAS